MWKTNLYLRLELFLLKSAYVFERLNQVLWWMTTICWKKVPGRVASCYYHPIHWHNHHNHLLQMCHSCIQYQECTSDYQHLSINLGWNKSSMIASKDAYASPVHIGNSHWMESNSIDRINCISPSFRFPMTLKSIPAKEATLIFQIWQWKLTTKNNHEQSMLLTPWKKKSRI